MPVVGGESNEPQLLSVEELEDKMHADLEMAAQAIGGTATFGNGQKSVTQQAVEGAEEEEYTEPMPEVLVAEEDKREFLRTLLAGERFKKTYRLFGDAIQVTFQTRTVKENRLVQAVGSNRTEKERKYMVCSLATLSFFDNDGTLKHVIEGAKAISETRIDDLQLVGLLSDIVYYAVLKQYREFEKVCDAMWKRANDRPFWTGTDGAG
jgi:hypothetical protein